MSVNLKLYTSDREHKNGYAVVIDIYVNKKRTRLSTGYFSRLDDWNKDKQIPLPSHPDYDYIFPKVIALKNVIKGINYDRIADIDKIIFLLLGKKKKMQSFSSFTNVLITEMQQLKDFSNADVYAGVLRQFESFLARKAEFEDVNYNTLNRFKQDKLLSSSKNTVSLYLRTIRAIYNKALRRDVVKKSVNFTGLFNNLKTRASAQKKKYILKPDILALETVALTGNADMVRDLFLLQFYLGGQDLKDIYYLKKDQINNNRIYLQRGKLSGKGYTLSLRLFDKAKVIFDKYKTADEFCFPWQKDYETYKRFRGNYGYHLTALQKILGIKIQPLGGNLAIKVARHSFANIGKRLFIEEDILRELMGHERDDIDNYYKDKYPEDVRDAAHWKIIDTKKA